MTDEVPVVVIIDESWHFTRHGHLFPLGVTKAADCPLDQEGTP